MAQAAESVSTNNVVFLRRHPVERPTLEPLEELHSNLIMALSGFRPHKIGPKCGPQDVQERADHVNDILKTVESYVNDVVGDTADRMPHGIIFTPKIAHRINVTRDTIADVISDLISDVYGAVEQGADTMEMTEECQ